MKLKFSIVTPSYNQVRFLRQTIDSAITQNYPSLEYIIIDGGSTDGSVDIIKEYEGQLAYWVSEHDKGQSDAIMKGFNRATGGLFCWLNSDDILLPGALRRVAGVWAKNPNIDIITGDVVYIDGNDYIVKCVRVPKQNSFFYRQGVGFFTAPATFFSQRLYEQVGGLDINLHYSMDIDLWHRFILAGAKVCHIKEYLGGFRIHTSSKTGAFRQKEKKAFENPETTLVRARYIPDVSKNTIRMFRILYKLWQVVNLNYLRGSVDLKKWKGKTCQEIFYSDDKN